MADASPIALEHVQASGGVVWFGSARSHPDGRHGLVAALLAAACQARDERAATTSPDRATALAIDHDALGRPWVRDSATGVESEIHVSFSAARDRVWAAMTNGGPVGIDVADAADFGARYPYERVFTGKERAIATVACGADGPAASALLWAIKEAATKVLGCGFHRFDYRAVEIESLADDAGWLLARICGRGAITVFTRREPGGWLALAAATSGAGR